MTVEAGAQHEQPEEIVTQEPPAKRQKKTVFSDGTAYGNYIAYYNKRTPSGDPDPRLKHLLPEWIESQKILDVGCNAGRVTIEIAQTMNPRRVIGVDIDRRLISKAKKNPWSIQSPSIPGRPSDFDPRYFPIGLPFMHGSLPYPPIEHLTKYIEQPEVETTGVLKRGIRKVMPERRYVFPQNVEFVAGDWVTTDIPSDRRGYNTIIAFSVTKWIHLNGLNEGLRDFFEKCYRLLLPGGQFILEPQPWSSYTKAARRDEKMREQWTKLKEGYDPSGQNEEAKSEGANLVKGLDPDTDFDDVLLEMGFDRVETLGKTGEKGFRRTIKVYHKRKGDWL